MKLLQMCEKLHFINLLMPIVWEWLSMSGSTTVRVFDGCESTSCSTKTLMSRIFRISLTEKRSVMSNHKHIHTSSVNPV